MSKFTTILILSYFVVITLGNNFWSWPLERYETPTCSSNNGTDFCLSCGIVIICLPQGNNYTAIQGSCPSTSPCLNGECSPDLTANVDCTCENNAGITYNCDPNNPQYYILCVDEDVNFLECPDGQVFDCVNNFQCITPVTTTTTSTTTTPPPPLCTEVGVFPSGCIYFFVCTEVGQPPTTYNCSEGEYFDPNANNCLPNEPFNCTTDGVTGDYRDPYDCQRYYVCAGTTLVFTDCCIDGEYYNNQTGVSACQPNNGECINAYECAPSAESSRSIHYREFDKWKNQELISYFTN